mmetsp:Transcript_40380/g.63053  ORF Transcript_40380/g.63053 Transcript_40380/m.63053 type:complete len:167 (+) Transcript_40380:305-805(+)
MSDGGLLALLPGLKQCLNLHTLSLNMNHLVLHQECAVAFGNLMMETQCARVTLAHNIIGDIAIRHLASHFRENHHLEALSVSENRISAEGSGPLAAALLKCKVLREFSIRGNLLGDKGAEELGGCLASHGALRRLLIGQNSMSMDGVQALMVTLVDCIIDDREDDD